MMKYEELADEKISIFGYSAAIRFSARSKG
jgi:hypothetical protein